MAGSRILTVVIGSSCSLCDTTLDLVRSPARILGVAIRTESLADGSNDADFRTRVPVLLDERRRVVAEGRVSGFDAWIAVIRTRLGRRAG